jgi:dual specificity protein phosphatase 1
MTGEGGGAAAGLGDPAEIVPRVLLGSRFVAADRGALAQHGVTHVLNCAREIPNHFADGCGGGAVVSANAPPGSLPTTDPAPLRYLKLELDDTEEDNIAAEWQRTTEFIDGAVAGGGTVFVHCQAGISRSAAIVMAHLMSRHGYTLLAAYERVKERRVNVGPNMHFMQALAALEDSLRPEAERGSPPSLTAEEYYARTLRDMGFAEHVAREAVRRADGRFELALDFCLLGA